MFQLFLRAAIGFHQRPIGALALRKLLVLLLNLPDEIEGPPQCHCEDQHRGKLHGKHTQRHINPEGDDDHEHQVLPGIEPCTCQNLTAQCLVEAVGLVMQKLIGEVLARRPHPQLVALGDRLGAALVAADLHAVEELLQQMSITTGLKYVIFRYFNVAGADPDGEIGEFHKPETHLIPIILDALDGKRDAITIFGNDYDTPDGTCIRDYVHVCDLADAHVLGLKWLEAGGANKIFNLGTGEGFSVREVIDHSSLVTERVVPVIEGARRTGDCTKLVCGSNLARDRLGWEPKRSSLKYMITDAWRWHQTGGYQK